LTFIADMLVLLDDLDRCVNWAATPELLRASPTGPAAAALQLC
jgi:hypothetical protein